MGKGRLSSRPVVKLGTISLSLYLIHFTLQYLAMFRSVILAAVFSISYASIIRSIGLPNPKRAGGERSEASCAAEECASIRMGQATVRIYVSFR
jgi:hypothetical protein